MGTNTGQVMTLANSIIGVSVLAMPYCFQQCGIVLSTLLLCLSSILSRFACHFLLKSAIITRRRNYEFLAFHVFGSKGKLGVELAIIGFLLGTCIAFFVVMGDLGPAIISSMFNLHRTDTLRTSVLICMALFVVLPLGLLRNVDSLSSLCAASFAFYLCLVLKVMGEATGPMVTGDWLNQVMFWRPEGVLQCLPIFSMALFCQTQLFEIFDTVPNAALDKLNAVVRVAINMCTAVYIFVGFFGYVAFCKENITGNILVSLSESMSSEVIKLGFVLSVAVSFPLVIFPCRASLYSLLYRSAQPPLHDVAGSHVPEGRFKMLTFSIVGISMVVGLLLPNIERVLGIIGSTIGVTICIIIPSLLLGRTARHPKDKFVSQVILWSGAVIMILGTYAHILNAGEGVGADPGLEQAANRILDHAVDQLNERPPDTIAFHPIPNGEKLKILLDTSADKILALHSDGLSDQQKANKKILIGTDIEKPSLLKNVKSGSTPEKPEKSKGQESAPPESDRKPLKPDEKVSEPVVSADAGEKQQEPPVPVEVVVKHASPEPAKPVLGLPAPSGDVVANEPKLTKGDIKIKQQQTNQRNETVVSNAQQVNQDAIRHEDAESALEAKDDKVKDIIVDKGIEKQNDIEERKKKAEEQKLIETLKEHQEVQRDMLNEQQRILQELKKHEKVQQGSVNEVEKDTPGKLKLSENLDVKPLDKIQDTLLIDSVVKQRNAESQLSDKEFVRKEAGPLSKSNVSIIANDQLQPPANPIQIEGEAKAPKLKESKYGKAVPIIPLPLAYSAKISSSSSAKVQVPSQPIESKPAARDILGSDLDHLEREKRDVVSVNNIDTDQGAGNGPLVDEEQKQPSHDGNLLGGLPDEECKQNSNNAQNSKSQFEDSILPHGNDASKSLIDKSNPLNSNGEKSLPLFISKSKVIDSTLTKKSHVVQVGSSSSKDEPVMELKTPSSISEPHVEIQPGLSGEVRKVPGGLPLPTKNYLNSVQNKEG